MDYILKPAKNFQLASVKATAIPVANANPCAPEKDAASPAESKSAVPVDSLAERGGDSLSPLLPPVPTVMERLDLVKGAEWCRILREARPLVEQGFTFKEIATMVGTSSATLCRLLKDHKDIATADLTPEGIAPVKSGGRECDWEFLLGKDDVKRKLLELYVASMGASSAAAANDRRTAKLAAALRNFAYEPECPEKLRARLLAGYQPEPFVRYLRAALTPELEAKVRGPKTYALYGPSSVRDWTCRLPNGDRFETPAVYTLSMDDMSCNHPFFVDIDGQTILSRQGIYALWAKHKVWQSVDLVARPRESYTGADILRAFYRMCLALHGVPPFVEFEQGIWKSKLITGFQRDGDWLVEHQVQRPEVSRADQEAIATGLGLCGVNVLYKYKAHQKHIETHFNALQTTLGIVARNFQHGGRYGGEYEHGAKQLRRIRAGSRHPRELGYASQAEMADCIYEAFRRSWEMPSAIAGKTRYEAHWDDVAQVGLLPLTDRLFAACLPGELKKTTIRGGYINIQSRHKDFQYRCEEFSRLGDGYEVYYKFDETDPNLGIAVFNRTSPANSANFRAWKMDEFMFKAPREISGPKLSVSSAPAGVEVFTVEQLYGEGAVDRGDTLRRKQDKANQTAFRSMPRPGQIAVRSSAARDGKGNVAEMTNAAPQAAGAATTAPRRETAASSPADALPPRPTIAQATELPYELRKLLQEQEA